MKHLLPFYSRTHNLVNHLFSVVPELKSKLVGCSEEEIKKLEKKFNLKLPQFYKDFLLTMGH